MNEAKTEEVRRLYRETYLPARDQVTWLPENREAVEAGLNTPEAEFISAAFQKRLWEFAGVASAGLGTSVNVSGAYGDLEVARALLQLRDLAAPSDFMDLARELDRRFLSIISLVTPRYNPRRPSARLARIFATLRPHDVTCLLSWDSVSKVRAWLDQPHYKLGLIGQQVIIREALREALGPEADLEDDLLYSQFAWFIYQRVLASADAQPGDAAAAPPTKATDRPSLTVRPATAQKRGLAWITQNVDVLRSVAHSAEVGIGREDLIQQIGEAAPQLNRSSRASVLAQALTLGLIVLDAGVYKTTTDGRIFLETDKPAEVLARTLVREIFGIALILDDLRRDQPLTRREIASRCRAYYPRWTTDFAQNSLIAWLRGLDLVEVDGSGGDAKVSLTEEGEYWTSGLPDNLTSDRFRLSNEAPDEPADEPTEAAEAAAAAPFRAIAFDAIYERFTADERLRSFVFSRDQIALVHAALHAVDGKRFVLLAGLSGTGKTSMARSYAAAYCGCLGLSDKHYAQIAVWPEWTDPSGLLGYVNPLANPPTFQQTETLAFLREADANPSLPYFLCLDEMNLARVEHYFAPFLSAMEGASGRLSLHAEGENIDTVPPSIPWPKNLFIIGTVNMDETTHPFSDKVLDRAFTFEFWTIDLEGWRERMAAATDPGAMDQVYPVLHDFKSALEPARRHFGYRTCAEVLGFYQSSVAAGLSDASALDAAVLAKILPKVRGDSGGPLPAALNAAIAICERRGFKQSGEKLDQMRTALDALGVVRFWS